MQSLLIEFLNKRNRHGLGSLVKDKTCYAIAVYNRCYDIKAIPLMHKSMILGRNYIWVGQKKSFGHLKVLEGGVKALSEKIIKSFLLRLKKARRQVCQSSWHANFIRSQTWCGKPLMFVVD